MPVKMRGKRVNRKVTNSMRPLELTPYETVERYLTLIENEAISPRIANLRDNMRRHAVYYDRLLGFFP